MAKRPSEEDLGIEPTAEEQEILARPPAPMEAEDDIPRDDGEDEEVAAAAQPQAEAPARVKDPVTGKCVAKPKEGEAAPVADAAPNPNKPPPGFVDNRALQEARAENK